ncbi:MAG: PKD domain-containing protein [Solirubrobacteraceae bacterium]
MWDSWTEGFLSHRVVQAAFRPAGGEWQAPVDLSEEDPLEEPYEPRVAIDEQGDAVVVWSSGYGESGGVMSAFKPSGDAWQVPVELSPPGTTGGYPQVAFDWHGDAIAVWGDSVTVQSALKPAGGNWQSSADLAGEGSGNTYDSPQVAFDGLGDVLVVWGNDRNIIRGSAYVVAGPALNNVSIPAEGTVGQPLTFSVSPFDVWSIPVETSWSFGDGASASGTSITHTYTAAGTYEVTLHSADTLGNVTSTSGKVTIAPAPATTTPSPSAPTPAGPDTSTVATPLLILMASEFVVAGSSAPVGVECQAAACRGSIELTVQVPENGKGKTAADHKATLILATGSFSLPEGKRGTVVLYLTAAGRKRFAHASMRHPIAAKLTLSVQGGKTATRLVFVG